MYKRQTLASAEVTNGTGTAMDPTVSQGQPINVAIGSYLPKIVVTIPFIGYLMAATKSIEGLIVLGLTVLFLIILYVIAELWKKDLDDYDDYPEDTEPGYVKSRKELKKEEKRKEREYRDEAVSYTHLDVYKRQASLLQTDATGLNEYAKNYKALYPIAARCGVFAKTDIQPLINDGATKEDLSASIFQAVVNQTISGLACGKPIRGHVAFLGGPLHFLDQLKAAFIRTLKLDDEHAITPENSHLFAAMGSAMNAKDEVTVSLTDMTNRLKNSIKLDFEVERMEPLFATEEDYEAFNKRQSAYQVKKGDLSQYHGNCCLLYTSRCV